MKHTHYQIRYAANPTDFKHYDTQRIRQDFLIPGLFVTDTIQLVYTHYDRYIAGGALPVNQPLALETIDPLKASFFLERRELGIINIGQPGEVLVDGVSFPVGHKEALYVGMGCREIIFKGSNARYYFNSAPAHQAYPCKLVRQADAEVVELGSLATSNARTIRKLLVNSVLPTCQLQMGMTELKEGSVWNTMPAHIHDRRMEVYLYFEVPDNQAVSHFMGQKEETRCVWVHNEQAVISPPWSMHCGAGTANYSFIWGMCGENLDYGDMDGFMPTEMK
ncbi:MAG: 5-dehydro-4-deoxy-D-glucuronate isomerase [Lewinellaceae bacterium]|nr:5-dehydro-4-deoxy-D-glucuronate isomerase [Lewinellaceae bacterium]